MEIERKFLVTNTPDLSEYRSNEITQGYISYSPEIRIRKKGDKFFITQKSEGTLVREELESEIDGVTYEILCNMVKGNLIEKTRYEIPLSHDIIAELDVYHGQLNGLCTVEVEFESQEQAESFIVPSWFGSDVTAEKKYKNRNLSEYNDLGILIEKHLKVRTFPSD